MALSITGVSHRYGDLLALADVTLELESGRVGLMGVNGAGKTTLLSIAAGALSPSEGAASVSGHDLYARRSRPAALRSVALMPQHLAMPGHLTAHEAVSYLTWMRGLRWRDATRAAATALADVGLADRERIQVRRLSGGMRRRVALAQALAAQPDLLLLDEPTTGLDPEQRRAVLDLIRSLPHSLVMSSHIAEDIDAACGRVAVLHQGRILFSGTTQELAATAPASDSARALEDGFVGMISAQRPT